VDNCVHNAETLANSGFIMQRDQDIWENILNQLEDHINEHSFKTWFSDTTLVDIEGNVLHVQVPTKFNADYMNQNYTVCGRNFVCLYKKESTVRFSTCLFGAPRR
jgi:hypothetical protein